jgi:hypothetical protein
MFIIERNKMKLNFYKCANFVEAADKLQRHRDEFSVNSKIRNHIEQMYEGGGDLELLVSVYQDILRSNKLIEYAEVSLTLRGTIGSKALLERISYLHFRHKNGILSISEGGSRFKVFKQSMFNDLIDVLKNRIIKRI